MSLLACLTGHWAQQLLFADFALPLEEQPRAKTVAPERTNGDCVLAALLGLSPTPTRLLTSVLKPRA